MKVILTCLFSTFIFLSLDGQISGTITNEEGEGLAFASIYIEGTSRGTTSNLDGEYEILLGEEDLTIVFQYIGYQNKILQLESTKNPQTHNIVMRPDSYALDEVVIVANAEDPAYAIMRKAIAKREYYKNLVKGFSCDVYIKGNQKLLDAPEKILGQEVGDLEGALDSTRQGIVYLSESISKYHYRAPDDYKEVMISSKVSGDDQGYSFNSAHEMNLNIYDKTTNLGVGRDMVSPLANNAMSYYKFKLEGVSMDSNGRLINKIKIRPRRKNDPAIEGYIYIVEDLWNVHSIDFTILPQASQIYFMDTLRLEQVFVPMEEPDVWVSFSSKATFNLGIMGFKLKGYFVGVYSNYELEPSFEEGFFTNELLKVEPEANKKDSVYWEKVRQVPLTEEEAVDYVRKDSIYEVRNSPAYLDSIDKEGNQFKVGNLLTGYSYRKRSKALSLELESPLTSIGFNTVQGYNANLKLKYFKYLDEKETKYLLLHPKLDYGFSEKKLRADFIFNYRFNRITDALIGVRGGTDIVQFKERPISISESWNTLYSLFLRENYAKYYDRKRLTIYSQGEISNGVFVRGGIDFTQRNELQNSSDASYFRKDSREYLTNDPLERHGGTAKVLDGTLLSLDIRLRTKQKYLSYPDRRIKLSSKYPDLWIYYRQGFPVLGGDVKFAHLAASLVDEISLGARGEFQYAFNGGTFFNKGETSFVDRKHFNANQLDVSNPIDYRARFLLLPYYQYSTEGNYVQLHFQHHFNGFVLDKVPGLGDLGWQLVVGAKYLKTSERENYREFHVGIDNIGYKLFRLFRVDLVYRPVADFNKKFGVVLGLKL